VWAHRPDRDDLGQSFLAAMTPGTGGGTNLPACVIHVPIKGRHRRSRYGAEVNVP
jgi:hypothetical protein